MDETQKIQIFKELDSVCSLSGILSTNAEC